MHNTRKVLLLYFSTCNMFLAFLQIINLVDEISRWQELHDAAVEGDREASAYVTMLEQRYDHTMERNMPSGDDLAAELEEFLRGQSDDDPS
jgi:hypothetical protein